MNNLHIYFYEINSGCMRIVSWQSKWMEENEEKINKMKQKGRRISRHPTSERFPY